jgi:two-component system, cell cycle response regulator DivK
LQSDHRLLASCDLSHFKISTKRIILYAVNKAEESAISLESVHQNELFVETGGAWRGRRILLVEDQEDNRQIVRDLLTATDCEIVEARDGKEAIAAASEEPPDLILMDIQLPIMSGYDAARWIKANPALRRIPIIAVTSYALSGEDAHARAAGCDEVVAKPYSPRHLLAKIRRFLP